GSRLGACYSRKCEGTRPAPFSVQKSPPGIDAVCLFYRSKQSQRLSPRGRSTERRRQDEHEASRAAAARTPRGRVSSSSSVWFFASSCLLELFEDPVKPARGPLPSMQPL